MTEQSAETQEAREEEREHYGHCGPWGGMHRKMWMYGTMFGRGRRGRGRGSRAQRWLYDNPTDDQIVEFLEEYQRDLEQQIEDVRTRIEDFKSRNEQ